MIRRAFLASAAATLLPGRAGAQPRVYRLGTLSTGQVSIESLRRWGLPELAREGFVVGRNLTLIERSSEGDAARLDSLAAEIAAARPDVAIAVSNPAAHALRRHAPALPIVMGFSGTDPVADGLAASLAHPGGLVTGVVMLAEELDAKRIELARDLRPGIRRLGFLAGSTFTPARIQATQAAAQRIGLELVLVQAGGRETYPAAFAALSAGGAEMLVIASFPGFASNTEALAALATAARLATICEWSDMVRAGCTASFGPVNAELRRRVASFVVRILRGEAPGNIAMEQATRFELAVNPRAAGAIGFDLPSVILARADEMIE